ncbi:hypothetical protein D3C78_1229660 [compost metagenome]
MLGVDQLRGDRRGIGQQAQPAERVDALEVLQDLGRDRLPRHAVEAVATGDVVAVDAHLFAILVEGQPRLLALEFVQLHVGGLVDGRGAAGLARRHEVAGDLGLAIDHHGLSAGQLLQVDALAAAVEDHLEAFVDQTLGVHARGDASLAQQIDHALLEHPGTNAAEDVVGSLAFDDQGLDAGVMQQLAEH